MIWSVDVTWPVYCIVLIYVLLDNKYIVIVIVIVSASLHKNIFIFCRQFKH